MKNKPLLYLFAVATALMSLSNPSCNQPSDTPQETLEQDIK